MTSQVQSEQPKPFCPVINQTFINLRAVLRHPPRPESYSLSTLCPLPTLISSNKTSDFYESPWLEFLCLFSAHLNGMFSRYCDDDPQTDSSLIHFKGND